MVWHHAFVRASAAVFLPVRPYAVRCAAAGPGAEASALGAGAAADLCVYPGDALPGGRAVLVQRRNELPAVFLAGRAECRACVCTLLCREIGAPPKSALRADGLRVQPCHRRRPSGSRAFERAGVAVGRGALRTAAQFVATARVCRCRPWPFAECAGSGYAGAHRRLCGSGLRGGNSKKFYFGHYAMAALAGCAAALPIGIAGAAAFAAGPQRGSARSGIPPSLAGCSSHFCADVGYDFPALLHDGRHRRGSASERRLDDFCAWPCRHRISAAGLAGACARRITAPRRAVLPAPCPPLAAGRCLYAGDDGLHRQPHGQRGPGQLLCHQPGSRL